MPTIRAAWERYWAVTDGPRGQCLVTGQENEPIALVHPAIKGVQGAQTAGAALVSFNCNSFTSYGKSQNLNASVGIGAAFAYTTALNHLLRPDSRRKLRIGDIAVVVWAERATPAETLITSVLGAISDEEGDLAEENRARPIHDQLLRIAAGRWADNSDLRKEQDIRFYILGLAPNAARLQLQFSIRVRSATCFAICSSTAAMFCWSSRNEAFTSRHSGHWRVSSCRRTRKAARGPTLAPRGNWTRCAATWHAPSLRVSTTRSRCCRSCSIASAATVGLPRRASGL